MKAVLSTSGISALCARHPWKILGIWLVLMVLAGVASSQMSLTTEGNFTNEPESVKAQNLIHDRLRPDDMISETIIIKSNELTVDDPAFKATVEGLTSELMALDGVIQGVMNHYQLGAVDPQLAGEMVSEDRHTALLQVQFAGEFDDAIENVDEYREALDASEPQGFEILTVGDVSSNEEFNSISEKDLQRAEIFGLPVALVILVVVFGALVAAGVPVILALVSIFISIGLAALVSQAFDLSFYVVNMITMIGLAVGIDYALFIIERFREERGRGLSKHDAIAATGGSASKAVLFSGLTVVLALIGMLLVPTTIFRSLAIGAILVVIVAVIAMLTLVPALLSLLGDKLNWPRWRKLDRSLTVATTNSERGFWPRVTRKVMAHPVIAVVLAVSFLLAAALPYLDMRNGFAGVESLPPGETKTAFEILEQEFYVGLLAPVQIVVDGPVDNADIQAATGQLLQTLEADDQFGPAIVSVSPAGDLTLIEVPLSTDANAPESYDAIDRLRDQAVPAAFTGAPADVLVAGNTAFAVDFNELLDVYTPIVFAFVLGLSFLLLMVAFRSLVVPAKAIIMNLLSVGAAYGLMVLVFQKGVGADLLGLQQAPTIDAWIPIFLFCVLFGLSMDYHVFLLSRIREHYDQTHDNRESVTVGLQSTAKIITGAALIMVVVFSAFASGNLVAFQQMGFGLAVAVFLDATIVRSVLVPASMVLLGDRNWYFPHWLGWLPEVGVEGKPATLR